MENSKKMNDFSTGEPQVLRKAEIARILNTVKQAPFNADNSNNSEDKSFKKRSLLDIALNSSKVVAGCTLKAVVTAVEEEELETTAAGFSPT